MPVSRLLLMERQRSGPVRTLLGVLLVFATLSTMMASSVGAQDESETAILAPAIGPWLGAPRGSISEVRAVGGGVEVTGVVRDSDSARPVSYELLVDGTVVREGTAPRPSGVGRSATFNAIAPAGDGLHRVCLRLLDNRFGARTVDCATATTAPPNTVNAAVASAAKGVLISPSGIVMPILGGSAGSYRVKTPCGDEIRYSDGTLVERARVVIDPGHGGSESGAHGGGLYEKNLNLEVAEHVVNRLDALGISAQLTRTADYRIPLRTRADIANALAPDVFLSLHHNGGAVRTSSRPGTEVFYAQGISESKRLAAIMYEEMVDSLKNFDIAWVSTVNEGASVRLRRDGLDLYGIHRYSPEITSIITEYVYLSNPAESFLMQRDGMVEREAEAIVDALLRWWWTSDAGTSLGRSFVDESSSGTGGFDNCRDPDLHRPVAGSVAFGHSASRPEVLIESQTPASTREEQVLTPAGSLLPALFLDRDPAVR